MKVTKAERRKVAEKIRGKSNGDLFVEVRQRVAAYKWHCEFHGRADFYDKASENDYLDGAYRFLYSSVEPEFILFCAEREKMRPVGYVEMLLGDRKPALSNEEWVEAVRGRLLSPAQIEIVQKSLAEMLNVHERRLKGNG